MDKKTLEHLFIDEISTLYKDFPVGTIICHEGPDFLINQNAFILGIEVENYIRGQSSEGSKKRQREMILKNLIDNAKSVFESSCSIPLFASFVWFPDRQPQQTMMKSFAESIAIIIADHIPSEVSALETVEYEELENLPIGDYLHSIRINRTNKHSSWVSDGGDFTEMRIGEIEWLISSKNSKIDQYLLTCDKVWLIIVADGEYISSYVDLTPDIINHPYQSKFERILFYDRVRRMVFQLSTC